MVFSLGFMSYAVVPRQVVNSGDRMYLADIPQLAGKALVCLLSGLRVESKRTKSGVKQQGQCLIQVQVHAEFSVR